MNKKLAFSTFILVLFFLVFSIGTIGIYSAANIPDNTKSRSTTNLVKDNLSFAAEQVQFMINKIGKDSALMPRSVNPDGTVRLVEAKDWTSGFFAGSLWYAYEYSKDDALLGHAKTFTNKLKSVQYIKNDHDVGFIMNCSYGNGYRLTNDEDYKSILMQTADSLSTRFNPVVGCTRSWDWGKWNFPVIIDNMMNLELLHLATNLSGNKAYREKAISHSDKTIINHYRSDHSTFHLVDYDKVTGKVIKRYPGQGYSESSAWSRGQAWGLYGYVIAYRETKDSKYLQHAISIANYILNNPSMPEDLIPYWDFDAPNQPNEKRDASAAAINASALYELCTFTEGADSQRFRAAADKMLSRLSSVEYRAQNVGENNGFILKHCVANMPEGTEIDVPLSYADYYFLEANIRKLRLENVVVE